MGVLTSLLLVAAGVLVAVAAPASATTFPRPFGAVFSQDTTGNVILAGNMLETCPPGSSGTNNLNAVVTCSAAQAGGAGDNDDYNMGYVDIDGNSTTFDSSSATVTIPSGATVLFAGLTWAGYVTGATAGVVAAEGTAEIAGPAGSYSTVTSSVTDLLSTSNYQAYANVTSTVQQDGSGSYTVANVQAVNGYNSYAGWSLAVAYRDPTLPMRNLVVYTGDSPVYAPSGNVSISLSGFKTPASGSVDTQVGVVAYEGDASKTGDGMSLNSTVMSNSDNPANNVFNSTNSFDGTPIATRNPSYANLLSVDIDTFDETGVLANGATTATISMTSTGGDTYYPGVITFVTDLYSPSLTASKTVTDLTSGNGANTVPGDTLQYSIAVTNTGAAGSTASVLTDAIPSGTTYVTNSLTVGGSTTTGQYSAGTVTAYMGSGASSSAGGTLAVGATTDVIFDAVVSSTEPIGSSISNQAGLSYQSTTPVASYTGASNTSAITVASAPSLSLAPPAGEVGVAYSDQLTESGGTGPYTWSSSGTLPPSLTLSSSGLLSGTPSGSGTFTPTIVVTDANGHAASQALSVTIAAVATLTFAPPPGELNTAYTYIPTVTGGTGPYAWTVSVGTLPAGLAINPTTGALTGSPTAAGTSNFTVRVVDTNGQAATQATSLTVAALPTLTFTPPAGQLTTAYTYTPTVTGGTGPYTSWMATTGSMPSGLGLNFLTGVLSGTPTRTGAFHFGVQVTDADGQVATATVTLLITLATPGIVLSVSSTAVNFGTSVTLTSTVAPTSASGTVTFSDLLSSGPQTGSRVTVGTTQTLSGGTASVTVALAAFNTNTITASYSGNSILGAATSAVQVVQVSAYSGELVVNQFRLSGPGGATDQYVEILNTGPAVPFAGFVLTSSSGAAITLPSSTPTLATNTSYLIAGAGYSLGSVAAADTVAASLGTGGIRIVAPDLASTAVDAVGFVGAGSGFFSGTALPAFTGTPTDQYAWMRPETSGRPTNTHSNAVDFKLVSTTGGVIGGLQSTLGSPSPNASGSPFQQNAVLLSAYLDAAVASNAAPNFVYVKGTPGTLTVRRTITNSSGSTITTAEIRITSLSETNGLPEPGVATQPAHPAGLRLVNAATTTSSVLIPGGSTVTVQNLSINGPATSPTPGGGLDTTLSIPLSGGLAPGATVNIAVTFAVDHGGTYWFGYDVDALLGSVAGPVANGAARPEMASSRVIAPTRPVGHASATNFAGGNGLLK